METIQVPERLTSLADARTAGNLLTEVKAAIKTVKDHYEPMKTTSHKAWKTVCDEEKQKLAPLLDAETRLKSMLTAWEAEEQRRLAEQKKAIEQQLKREQEDRLLDVAEATGDLSVLDTPPEVSVTLAPERIDGVQYRTRWVAEVTDAAALLRAIADGKAPLTLITINVGACDEMARAMKETLNVPGLKAVQRREVAARR